MLDLDRTMFFKAKFEVAEKSGNDALWAVIMSLKYWSTYKARRDEYDIPKEIEAWTALKWGSILEANDARVKLISSLHQEEDVYTWACQHIEEVRVTDCAPRRWITEIGFEGLSHNSGTVSVITMYRDMPGFLGPLQETPNPSIPALVRNLADNKNLLCTIDGHPLVLSPNELALENSSEVYRIISDQSREVPVIICSPSCNGELALNPEAIVKQLGPNALVFFTHNKEVIKALNDHFPADEFKCFGGAVRIYAPRPNFAEQADSYNHRFFSYRQVQEYGEEYFYGILRRALAEDIHFWETSIRLDDIKRLNRMSMRERQAKRERAEFENSTLDEVAEMIDAADKRAENAETDLDNIMDELKDCKKRLHETENRMNAYAHSLEAMMSVELEQTLNDIPDLSLEKIAQLFVKAYPERLDFSKRGWDSLTNCVTAPDVFWHALHSICTVLHPLYSETGTPIVQAFNNQTRLTLTLKESETTENNDSLMRQREDEYQGRRLFIEPHIKSGNGDPSSPKFVHIYFNRDEKTGRLVIGDTKHLDVSTTPKR